MPSFQGCCASNPCAQGSCPIKDLRPAGIPAAGIVSTNEPNTQCPSTSQWYTCLSTTPTSFQGCCKSNPCQQNGCPTQDLEAAQFKVIPGASSTLQSSTQSSTATSTPTHTSTSAAVQPNITAEHSNNTPIIAGVVVGGVVLIALIICGFLFLKSRRKKEKNAKRDPSAVAMMAAHPNSPGMQKSTPTDGTRSAENGMLSPQISILIYFGTNHHTEGYYSASQGTPRPDHDPSKSSQHTRDGHLSGPPPYASPQPSPNQPVFSPQISLMSAHPSPNGGQTWGSNQSHHQVHEMVDSSSTNIPQQLDSTEMPASARAQEFAVELPGVAVTKPKS